SSFPRRQCRSKPASQRQTCLAERSLQVLSFWLLRTSLSVRLRPKADSTPPPVTRSKQAASSAYSSGKRTHRRPRLCCAQRQLLPHTGWRSKRRDDVLGISRDSMLVQIHAISFLFRRQTQHADGVHRKHHSHGDTERRQGNASAADRLRFEHLESAS